MISRIRGKLIKKDKNQVIIDVGGISYQINIPSTVYTRLKKENKDGTIELVIYHYLTMEKNRGIPVLIGFIDELEREFFEEFISVSGIGPKAALKAFDKPIALIAQAIEEANIDFLKTLAGIGRQKAKQIIAHLQGKVGRFALIKEEEYKEKHIKKEIVEEAKEILKRLQYSNKEIEEMLKGVLKTEPIPESVEELLNKIYHQRKNNSML
jgi:Holliday junction DNA helicase RuvA